ncbi:MAG: DUF4350 domain-containing protein [Verrucomicrobiota bacterium]
MRVSSWLRVVGVGLALEALAGCGKGRWEEVTETKELGYRGRARVDPYFAAESFLREMGIPQARSLSGLNRFPETNEALLVNLRAVPGEGMARRLQEWVQEGGHLLCATSETAFEGFSFFESATDSSREVENRLLDLFGVARAEEVPESLEEEEPVVRWGRDEYAVKGFSGSGLLAPGSQESSAVVTFPYGSGRFTALSDGAVFHNRRLGEAEHARLLWDLVSQESVAGLALIYGGPSFWQLLWERGWAALWALGAWIVFWLWRNLSRADPVLDPELFETRELRDHIRMVGRFLWREKAAGVLLGPLQAQLRRRLPGQRLLGSSSQVSEAQWAELTRRTGLPRPRLQELFHEIPETEGAEWTQFVRDLQLLDERLPAN